MPYYNSYQQSYATFQPNYQQSYQQQPQMQTPMQTPINPQNTGIIWVQGEIGARAYPVAAGNSVLLMDSEGQNFFIKSADMSGMPTMKRYSYSEVVEEPLKLESHDNRDYDTAKLASRDEVKKLQEEVVELKKQLEAMGANAGGKQNG